MDAHKLDEYELQDQEPATVGHTGIFISHLNLAWMLMCCLCVEWLLRWFQNPDGVCVCVCGVFVTMVAESGCAVCVCKVFATMVPESSWWACVYVECLLRWFQSPGVLCVCGVCCYDGKNPGVLCVYVECLLRWFQNPGVLYVYVECLLRWFQNPGVLCVCVDVTQIPRGNHDKK